MILKLSKTALRELKRFYHAILMGIIISGFISATAYATVSVVNGDGTQSTIYTSDEVDGLLSAKQDTLIAGSVQTNNLADSATTANKIQNDAVGQNHIANGAIGTAEIKNESITKTKLDSSLQASINQVDTNKTAIETLNGDANTVGSVANTVNTAVNNLATGAGHYRGTTGFALGAFHHVNDNVLLNVGAAYGGNGLATFKGGLTFGW